MPALARENGKRQKAREGCCRGESMGLYPCHPVSVLRHRSVRPGPACWLRTGQEPFARYSFDGAD